MATVKITTPADLARENEPTQPPSPINSLEDLIAKVHQQPKNLSQIVHTPK